MGAAVGRGSGSAVLTRRKCETGLGDDVRQVIERAHGVERLQKRWPTIALRWRWLDVDTLGCRYGHKHLVRWDVSAGCGKCLKGGKVYGLLRLQQSGAIIEELWEVLRALQRTNNRKAPPAVAVGTTVFRDRGVALAVLVDRALAHGAK